MIIRSLIEIPSIWNNGMLASGSESLGLEKNNGILGIYKLRRPFKIARIP